MKFQRRPVAPIRPFDSTDIYRLARSGKTNRNARLPRHSKSFFPNLRTPGPLWVWGLPKTRQRSEFAGRPSTFSLLGRSRKSRITAGSGVSAANQLLQLFCCYGHSSPDRLSLPKRLSVACSKAATCSGAAPYWHRA